MNGLRLKSRPNGSAFCFCDLLFGLRPEPVNVRYVEQSGSVVLSPRLSGYDPPRTFANLPVSGPAMAAMPANLLLRRDGSALLDCPFWRPGGGRCRLPRYLTGPACRIGRSEPPARRTERLDGIGHSGAHHRLMLGGAHP